MVVLAAAVVTKSGKAVISRQFREMQRARIEGLLASFPKLTSTGQQHTTVETEHVRYVYQPLDEMFMVLITNRQSNILQDIDSLHLFARVVSDTCRTLEEREILRNAFELLSSFDEIISEGYRENVNLAQVRSIIEMESHEEKIQEIIARNKEQEAKEELKRRAKQLEMQRREAQKRGQSYMAGNYSGNFGNNSRPSSTYNEPTVQSTVEERSSYNSSPALTSKAKGMQLGKKGKSNDLFEALKTEVGLEESMEKLNVGGIASPRVPHESVHVVVEEKITVVANRDGGLETMEVKGSMTLKIADSNITRVRLLVRATDDGAVQFQTHPNVDKALFKSDNVITLKDASRGFPVNQPVGFLKWRLLTKDESSIPLSINCWPSPAGDGTCDVNIDFELQSESAEFRGVIISIPITSGANPTVGNLDGTYEVDRQRRALDWHLPIIDASNKTGSIEFNAAAVDAGAFFPVSVSFESDKTFCDVEILDVQHVDTGASVVFSKEVLLSTEEYSIV
ncbi:hypothetical protein BC936DRAFT_144446 [Jimgerdemannia flammicorona]|uniref:Coatomer subunit delta n=1 Tax=Jimgerdemannia flammicorona TaxID=994334 RepID=A0A433DCI4_9FUNG|nr:hypothetical protein BC936DRAFT_144446 [Jimgerdemannia flammicorona]